MWIFVPESHQTDFHQQWWMFNGLYINSEASLTAGTGVKINPARHNTLQTALVLFWYWAQWRQKLHIIHLNLDVSLCFCCSRPQLWRFPSNHRLNALSYSLSLLSTVSYLLSAVHLLPAHIFPSGALKLFTSSAVLQFQRTYDTSDLWWATDSCGKLE